MDPDQARDLLDPGPLPALDSPPRSGVFIDHDAAELTAADITAGNELGDVIDVDDDTDGGVHR